MLLDSGFRMIHHGRTSSYSTMARVEKSPRGRENGGETSRREKREEEPLRRDEKEEKGTRVPAK